MKTNERPHRLAFYEQAVQQPWATAAMLARMHAHMPRDAKKQAPPATLLREDFAGTCAVAAAWCESIPGAGGQAMAVEVHGPTLRHATRRFGNIADLHLIEADVLDVRGPKVDVTATLNFSTFIYHDAASLLRYFKHARKGLRPGGVLVCDLFGGPGAERVHTQTRRGDGFVYHWEQKTFDPLSRRLDARIHFTLDDGTIIHNAFRYDWRLWTPPEVGTLLREAGFGGVSWWSSAADARGKVRPVKHLPGAEDWVVYAVARR